MEPRQGYQTQLQLGNLLASGYQHSKHVTAYVRPLSQRAARLFQGSPQGAHHLQQLGHLSLRHLKIEGLVPLVQTGGRAASPGELVLIPSFSISWNCHPRRTWRHHEHQDGKIETTTAIHRIRILPRRSSMARAGGKTPEVRQQPGRRSARRQRQLIEPALGPLRRMVGKADQLSLPTDFTSETFSSSGKRQHLQT
jgi:hypothetical protein